MTESVSVFFSAQGGLGRGARVLLACSGGADSVALLDIMDRLAPSLGVELLVSYVDHGSVHAPEAIPCLKAKCARRGLPLLVTALAPERMDASFSETELRSARLDLLHTQMRAQACCMVLLAHTADDQVETVLWRILRGTGTKGLGGMLPVRDGWLVRPLLGLRRALLREYARSRRLTWVEDPGNEDLDIPRNLLRMELLPWLRKAVNPAVDEALLRLARASARDEDCLRREAESIDLGDEVCAEEDEQVEARLFRSLAPALQVRLLLRMWAALNERGSRLEQERLEEVLRRWTLEGGRPGSFDLPGGVRAFWDGDRLGLTRRAAGPRGPAFSRTVSGPGCYELPDGRALCFEWVERVADPGDGRTQACFDGAKVGFPLELRSIKPGDIMRPFRGKGRRKLARLLIDEKVPQSLRHLIPVLVSGSRILWLVGIRRSDQAILRPDSSKVLRVRFGG